MIPAFAIRLASGITRNTIFQKMLAVLFLVIGAAIAVMIVVMLIRSGNEAAVKDDRQGASLDATKIKAAAENAAAHFQQGAEIDRQRGYDQAMEQINASERDADGDPLAVTLDGMR